MFVVVFSYISLRVGAPACPQNNKRAANANKATNYSIQCGMALAESRERRREALLTAIVHALPRTACRCSIYMQCP